MLRAPPLLALLALAACGGGSRDVASPSASDEVTVISSNFQDSDQTDWPGRSPDHYAVHGSDVSRYQTSVNWREARANGINFVFVKATEGADDVDPMFRDHWRGARAAGIATGAYHFWYHCAPGLDQARNFIARVPRAPGALPPVLDLEWTPFSPTCTRRTPQDELLREAQVFIDRVAAHYGRRPLVYVSPDIFEQRELWRLRGVEFWARSVADHPTKAYPGLRWTFWQYSGTGLVPGISGNADLNVFAGSRDAWAEWLAGRAQ
jgi:lysozyme